MKSATSILTSYDTSMHPAPGFRARLASFSSIVLLVSSSTVPCLRACPATGVTRGVTAKTSSAFGNGRHGGSVRVVMRGHYRHDGVKITHDPHAPGMAEKYGIAGNTDSEGFDPYLDSVGAGIYSGIVKRSTNGAVRIGVQYQNHNERPGPVYAGGGYTPVSHAIASFSDEINADVPVHRTTLSKLLTEFPDLVNDVATGGATPLHTCGMSRKNQRATKFLIEKGGDVEALDTYGYTPLDRMASNNLSIGAYALLHNGAILTKQSIQIAKDAEARDVLDVLNEFRQKRLDDDTTSIHSVRVFSPTRPDIHGRYHACDGTNEIPEGFKLVCVQNKWNVETTWQGLNSGHDLVWFKHAENDAYVYRNSQDGCWWIDGPDGFGVFKARGPKHAPPGASTSWQTLDGEADQPTVAIFRGRVSA